MTEFRKELENLINRFSKENGSNTPDFILADYLADSLEAFDKAEARRTKWYTKEEEEAPSSLSHDAFSPEPGGDSIRHEPTLRVILRRLFRRQVWT